MHSINHDYFAFTAFFKFLRNIEKYRIFFAFKHGNNEYKIHDLSSSIKV